MLRGEIRYADIGGGWGRRPVLFVQPSELIPSLSTVICAPITTGLRGLRTRVAVGAAEGLPEDSEAVCEALLAIRKDAIDTVPLGSLDPARFVELDRAIARALDVRRANLLRA